MPDEPEDAAAIEFDEADIEDEDDADESTDTAAETGIEDDEIHDDSGHLEEVAVFTHIDDPDPNPLGLIGVDQ